MQKSRLILNIIGYCHLFIHIIIFFAIFSEEAQYIQICFTNISGLGSDFWNVEFILHDIIENKVYNF